MPVVVQQVFPTEVKDQCFARFDIKPYPTAAQIKVMYPRIIDNEVRLETSVRMDGHQGGTTLAGDMIVCIDQGGGKS